MITISSRHNSLELIKLADFLQAENTEIFNKKFEGKDPDYVKELADRFYFIFKPMKDYNEYRSLANSISTIEDLETFLAKCDGAVSIISKKISSFGIREGGTINMAKQFVQKYYKDLDFIIPKVNESNTEEDLFFLLRPSLRSEKKKINNEFEGKDISGLSAVYTDWILKIFELSKTGGEAHSIDDIISLAKTFKSSEQKLEKKISEFASYSEVNNYLNDNSGVSKKVYTESIRVAAQENDMSRIVYDDDRWTVVLIGSTIGGQWWGSDTDFCISTIENNLYSSYATRQKIDPYFIIDKLAQSSDPMRKFTIAIQYDGIGKFKISNDSYTMTDARNIGITLDSIYAALGQDKGKIFDSIMQDAGSRKENIGTTNKNKIVAKISEKDYEFIRKYEKEIIANKNLEISVLNGINNTGDAEKVKNIIKSCAEKDPSEFLKNFADKPWAEHYIGIAAKSYAEKEPKYFLHYFADRHWAKPHINIAAKSIAESDPEYFLKTLIDKPWAQEPWAQDWAQDAIHTAANSIVEKDSYAFIKDFADKPWAKDYTPIVAKSIAEKNPFFFLYNFTNKPWAKPHINIAAKSYAERYPDDFLLYFIDKPWANEPREDLDGKSFVQYAEEVMQKESSYSPRLTKLAKILRSLGLSKEASLVLRIR
jgi:hypothetical protein